MHLPSGRVQPATLQAADTCGCGVRPAIRSCHRGTTPSGVPAS